MSNKTAEGARPPQIPPNLGVALGAVEESTLLWYSALKQEENLIFGGKFEKKLLVMGQALLDITSQQKRKLLCVDFFETGV